MQITIGCLDGNQYSSSLVSDEEVMGEIEKGGGTFPDVNLNDVPVNNIDELKVILEDWLKPRRKLDTQTFTLKNKYWGAKTFNVQHIVWFSVVADADANPF